MLQIGSMVRVKQNAYEGSDDPSDFEVRGRMGEIFAGLDDDVWEVRIGNDWFVLKSDELEEIEFKEEIRPDEPRMRELADNFRRLIDILGWDEFERVLVQTLGLELVRNEGGKRVYKRADGELVITFGQADIEKPDQALRIGQTDVCQGCSQPIYYVGPYWKHAGERQPRHIAVPKTNYKDKSN